MKKKVYFVRHGESEGNMKGVFVDGSSPLTTKGVEQAKFLAKRFTNIPIEIIVSSDMIRARQTAEEVRRVTSIDIINSNLFREARRPSEMIGRIEKENEDAIAIQKNIELHADDEKWHHSDEENTGDLKERARKALTFLQERNEENILVVMHGTFLKMLIGMMMYGDGLIGSQFWHLNYFMKTKNTGITLCRNEGDKWELFVWNDHAHLG